jgi:hypothetical protein
MYRLTLQEARSLARKFIEKADASMKGFNETGLLHVPPKRKETAALFRASMELTRKLADLRQNR